PSSSSCRSRGASFVRTHPLRGVKELRLALEIEWKAMSREALSKRCWRTRRWPSTASPLLEVSHLGQERSRMDGEAGGGDDQVQERPAQSIVPQASWPRLH